MKITKTFLIFLIISVLSSFYVYALDTGIITTNKTIWDILNKALSWFVYFVMIVAVVMILYVGFLYITSEGNKTKIENAFRSLKYIIIGLIILLLAQTIVDLVKNFITNNSSNLNNTTNTTEIIDNTNDGLSNTSFDELLKQSWYSYKDPNCDPTYVECCKCCKQGLQDNECNQNRYFI